MVYWSHARICAAERINISAKIVREWGMGNAIVKAQEAFLTGYSLAIINYLLLLITKAGAIEVVNNH